MPNETALEPTQSEEAVASTTTSIFDELDEQEQSSTETGEVEEVAEVEAEAEGATEEAEDSDWLPDTQLKEFPAEIVAKYAKRYGYTDEEIAADPRLQKALKDKINSDIEIANRKKAEEAAAAAEEETEAEAAEPTPEEAAALQTQREQKLTEFVHQITDKATAIKFTDRLAKADAIKDPEQRSVAVAEALTMGMANVFPDLVDAYLAGPGGYLEQKIKEYVNAHLPGMSETAQSTVRAQTVDRVAASNPKFAALGIKFGTPEFEAAALKASKILPGMEAVPLPFEQKVAMMFNLLTNAPGAVANATALMEKGKQVERESRQRKSAATLGAGHSKGLTKQSTSNDDIFGAPGEVQISGKLIGKKQS
jgi:chemotaxis protein histidine kinase CheA